MNKLTLGVVFAPLVLISATANSGTYTDGDALHACGQAVAKKIGVTRYTTFDKRVGVVRQEDGSNRYYINATYKHPSSDETMSYRSACDARGFKVSVVGVSEGIWSFASAESLEQQLASINF